MRNVFLKKLRSRAGETLTETLVALLIASLALVMLASMISSTTRIVTQSKTRLKTYYTNNNQVAAHSGGSTSVTMTLAPDSTESAGLESKGYSCTAWQNSALKNTPVVSYRVTATPPADADGGGTGGGEP